MGNMILIVLLCIVIPILMLSGLLDSRSRRIAIALAVGCCTCLASYFLNSYLYTILDCSYFYLSTSVSPLVEETMKFLPILAFVVFSKVTRQEQIVPVAFSVGIGFSIIENSYMLLQSSAAATIGWMVLRGIGTGLMHGMSTAMIGMGLYLARQDRRLVFVGTLSSLFLAIMYHGAYNCMIQTESIKFFGILLPICTYIAVFLLFNKERIRELVSG